MPIAVGNRPPRSVLLPVLGAIVLLAWITLWWFGQSDYGWLFHRHGTDHHQSTAAIPGWVEAVFFLAGWLVMTVAMMLPTTVPLVLNFQRMVVRRKNAASLTALLLAGYLLAWLGFGVLALALLSLAQFALTSGELVSASTWSVSASLLLMAGGFQFTRLKYACLDKCRTPAGFVISHWHGRRPGFESLQIGWSHGLFCVGCCWALMLLMFGVSTANLAWMLLLAVIMAIEKNLPWGRKIGRPLGATLIAAGLLLVVVQIIG